MRVARTFAFVDLSGFTQFTDLHGDDEAVAVLSQFRAALRATASDIGVRVAKWLGDGAMLVVGRQPRRWSRPRSRSPTSSPTTGCCRCAPAWPRAT